MMQTIQPANVLTQLTSIIFAFHPHAVWCLLCKNYNNQIASPDNIREMSPVVGLMVNH